MEETKKNRHFRSLSLRLFITLVILFLVTIVGLEYVIYNVFKTSVIENRSDKLSNRCIVMANKVMESGAIYTGGASEKIIDSISQIAKDYNGRAMIIDSSAKVIYDTASIDEGKYVVDPSVLKALEGVDYNSFNPNNMTGTTVISIKNTTNDTVIGALVVSTSSADLLSLMSKVYNVMISGDIIFMTIVICIIFVICMVNVRPYRKLKNSIRKIYSGEETSIEQMNIKELREIINAFNVLIEKMNNQDRQRKEFVSNVSHELKTPITSMRVLADSLLSMPDASKELYQEFMQDISNEIDRESKIITDLLELVRMDNSAVKLDAAMVNINEWLQDIMKRLLPIAGQRKIELVLESYRDVIAKIDSSKLTLAISNLIENAIKYNVDSGYVHVSLNADHKFFFIKVEDNGVGIPEDAIDKIFDRFYRVDKARSRDAGGTGLGLAITKSIIQMHKGSVKVYSKVNVGTTFSVRIPLNYDEGEGMT